MRSENNAEYMQVNFSEPKKLDKGLGVPYPKVELPTSTNIGYFDTKRFPEKIDIFPELKGWPEIKDLIKVVNQTDSIFRSLRCDVAQCKIARDSYRHKISSYVTLAFEILEWNSKENFKQLHDEFLTFAKTQSVRADNIVEFVLEPTSYNEHAYIAWSVDIWDHGFGRTGKEAKRNWLSGLCIIKAFVADQNQRYRNQLFKARRKIGDILI